MAATVNMIRTRTDELRRGKCAARGRCRRWIAGLACALVLASGAGPGAQEPIRRCIGSSGEPVFSDQPCAPGTRRESAVVQGATAPDLLTRTCATSAEALRDRIAEAFAARNALAFSGLLLWDDYRRGEATPLLQDLARLVEEPLVAIEIIGDRAQPAFADARDRPFRQAMWSLTIRTARNLDHVPHEAQTSFTLTDNGGCWWLVPGYRDES